MSCPSNELRGGHGGVMNWGGGGGEGFHGVVGNLLDSHISSPRLNSQYNPNSGKVGSYLPVLGGF